MRLEKASYMFMYQMSGNISSIIWLIRDEAEVSSAYTGTIADMLSIFGWKKINTISFGYFQE